MAITLVKSALGNGSTSATATFGGGGSASAGNLLVVVGATRDDTTGTANNLSCTAGFTAGPGSYDATNGEAVKIWYKTAAGGETGATVSNGNTATDAEIYEFTGLPSWIIDANPAGNTSGSSVSSHQTPSSGTLASATEVVIAGVGCSNNTSAPSFNSGFTTISDGGPLVSGYKIVSATTAEAPTATLGNSGFCAGVIASFRENVIFVDSDLDLRWQQSAGIDSDLDLRWKLGGTLDSDLDLRWTVDGRVPAYGVRFDVAFGNDPFDRPTAGEWTTLDRNAHCLRDVVVKRGVKVLSSGVEAGTLSAKVKNANRALDPSNTASAYAPNVKPRKRVQLVLELPSGGEIELFTGFINRLPIEWRNQTGWLNLSASDVLNLVAGLDLPPSVLDVVMRDLAPVSYWPMTETVFHQQADDVIGNNDGQFTGTVQTGQQIVPYETRPSPKFVQDTNEITTTAMYAQRPAFSDEITLVAWIAQPPVNVAGIFNPIVLELVDQSTPYSPPAGDVFNPSPAAITVIVDPGGIAGRHTLSVRVQDGSVAGKVKGLVDHMVFDGKAHLIAAKIKASTKTIQVSIDGTAFHTPSNVGGSYSNISSVNFTTAFTNAEIFAAGWGIRVQALPTVPLEGIVGHPALFDRLLSDTEIENLYEAGYDAWDGDLTGARLERILDLVGVDAGDRDIDNGTQTCGPALLGGNALAYIRKLVATEQGVCYGTGDGKVRFTDRLPDSPTIVQVFSDNPATDGGVPMGEVKPDYAYDRIINDIKVERENGAAQSVTNATSRQAYGPLSGALGGTLETLHQNADDARDTGQRIVDRYGEPRIYISAVTLDAADEAVSLSAVTEVEVGNATTTKVRPAGGGSPINQTGIVESVEHRLPNGKKWKVSYSLVDYPLP